MIVTVRRTTSGDVVAYDLTGFRVDPFELIDRLDALGDADAIAGFMRAERVHGYAGLSHRCPLAIYLERETGVTASVGMHTYTPRRADPDAYDLDLQPSFPLPTHVDAFVEGVDLGDYPDLARDPEELISVEAVAGADGGTD